MPKNGKLDRCHEHVKEALEEQGVEDADGKAWGVCKKRVTEDNSKDDSTEESSVDKKPMKEKHGK